MVSHSLLPVAYTATEPYRQGGVSSSCEDATKSFEVLYEQYQRRLIRVAFGILKNQADAEDAVQDSLLRAYTKLESFRGDSAIYTWLVRIVINTSLMALRKRSRTCNVSLDCDDDRGQAWADRLSASGVSAEAEAISREHRDLMLLTIAKLAPVPRCLMAEWIERDCSLVELSNNFGMSLPAVKSRILRGKQQVVQMVKRRL